MNRSKLPMPAKMRKKMNKEIRASAETPAPKLNSNDIKAGQLLSRYPAKIKKKEASILKSFEKTIDTKKKKQAAKHSKRTTPGTVPSDSPPKIVHVEGKRWIQTIEKQTQAQKKVFNRRMSKKGYK